MFGEQDKDNLGVKYTLYWSVFHYHFNLAFGHPATDVCATCTQHKLRLKNTAIGTDDRTLQIAQYILHRRRARTFYNKLNPRCPDSLTIFFDVMENLCLPKTAIGQAYYSRQLYLYVFVIVLHTGERSEQSLDNVLLYIWREHQGSKDSDIIASAVNHALKHKFAARLEAVKTLRIFQDSCFGQNKNMAMMSMLMNLASKRNKNNPLVTEYHFPIRGHSFLPADRVFGRIEQDVRKKESILLPSEYISILKKHGTVLCYTEDWSALDFKAEVKRFVKAKRSFKLSEARVVQLKDGILGMKETYNGELAQHIVLKQGKRWSNFAPRPLVPKSHVKPAKRTDVFNLLNELGAPESVVTFYQNILVDVNEFESDSGSN